MQVQATPAARRRRGLAARALHQRRLLRVRAGRATAWHRGAHGAERAPTVDVVEYYNASLDHYFITWIAAEMANLDAGVDADAVDAHRPHVQGVRDAAGADEPGVPLLHPAGARQLALLRAQRRPSAPRRRRRSPALVLEDPDYMHVVLPTAGTCPSGTQPVYRVFNNRPTRTTATRSTARCATRWWRRAGSPKATGRTAS